MQGMFFPRTTPAVVGAIGAPIIEVLQNFFPLSVRQVNDRCGGQACPTATPFRCVPCAVLLRLRFAAGFLLLGKQLRILSAFFPTARSLWLRIGGIAGTHLRPFTFRIGSAFGGRSEEHTSE